MITELNLSKVYNKCYYRIFEILSHNTRDNFWVILDRRVLNLSTLMRSIDEMPTNGKNQSALEQLMMFGGSDISELFFKRLKNKLEMFELTSPSEYGMKNNLHWWNDPVCIVGGITAQERHICVRNKIKGTQRHLTVCEEDSIYVIQCKYFTTYSEEKSDNIIWRKTEWTCCSDGHLFLQKTLTENGLNWDPSDEIIFLWMFQRNESYPCARFM